MVHGWVISAKRIVEDIPIGERIYKKKIVSKMVVFAETPCVRENSIQALKIIVIFSSNWRYFLVKVSRLVAPSST